MSMKIALAGNPNCGKTTLFNGLTGANQFVGNWPGVTVEKKEGKLKGHNDVIIMDLPGIYSLSPYTLEEVVARGYLINERPDAILNIVDGTNLERNLYLSTQLAELGIPMVMAVNMMDVVKKNGDQIFIDKLSEVLGCKVVEISALKGTGIKEAAEAAVKAASAKQAQQIVHTFDKKVENALTDIENMLGSEVPEEQKRFFAIKLFERDDKIKEQMAQVPDVEGIVAAAEQAMDDDSESIITNERYVYISSIIGKCCKKAKAGKMTTSDKIDQIVTNRFLALPIFAVVMFLVYYVSVTTVGTFVTDWTNDVLFGEIVPPAIEGFLTSVGCAGWLQSLILDGIVAGVGAVLGFVPQMLVLFIFLAILEDCGYMARVAFIMDRIFRKFGLSGKSFIPMLMDSAGNSGSQTSVTVIRNLALGEIELRDWPHVLAKEIGVAVVSGAALALVNFLRIIIFTSTSMMIAAVVSVTLFCTVIIAMIVGCLLPIGAKKLGFDPAVMASPMITTIVDACSLMIYFLIATSMLGL